VQLFERASDELQADSEQLELSIKDHFMTGSFGFCSSLTRRVRSCLVPEPDSSSPAPAIHGSKSYRFTCTIDVQGVAAAA
jgi:hypothetical protein